MFMVLGGILAAASLATADPPFYVPCGTNVFHGGALAQRGSDLGELVYADSDHGFFASHDGGVTWERRSPAGLCPRDGVQFFADLPAEGPICLHSWELRKVGNTTEAHRAAFCSADGAQNWAMLPRFSDWDAGRQQRFLDEGGQRLVAVRQQVDACKEAGRAWSGEPFALVQSSDGGQTWTFDKRLCFDHLDIVGHSDATHVLAVARRPMPVWPTDPSELPTDELVRIDLDTTQTEVIVGPWRENERMYIDAVANPHDAQQLLVVQRSLSATADAFLYESTDGGVTFNRSVLPPNFRPFGFNFVYLDDQGTLAAGLGGPPGPHKEGIAIKRVGTEETWHVTPAVPGAAFVWGGAAGVLITQRHNPPPVLYRVENLLNGEPRWRNISPLQAPDERQPSS